MKSLKDIITVGALALTAAFMPNYALADAKDCVTSTTTIDSLYANIEYLDGTKEKVPLFVETGHDGRLASDVTLQNGKRVIHFERNDVKNLGMTVPGENLYDGTNGIQITGTASINGEDFNLNDYLANNKLEFRELQNHGGELEGVLSVSKFVNGERGASLEVILDLDKTRIVEKPINPNVPIDPFIGESNDIGETYGPEKTETVPVSGSRKPTFWIAAGLGNGPTAVKGKLGPEYTLGIDGLFGSDIGGYIKAGGLPQTSNTDSEEHIFEYSGNNRRHDIFESTTSENDQLYKFGAGLSIEPVNGIHAQVGGGIFSGDRSKIQYTEVAITDLDGNHIVDPVSDLKTLFGNKTSPYYEAGVRIDLGKKWGVQGMYQNMPDDERQGFSAALVREF